MQYNVDYLTEVIFRLSQAFISKQPLENVSLKVPTSLRKASRVCMSAILWLTRISKWKKSETRYTDREWNDEEASAFTQAVQEYGGELRLVRDDIPTRTMPEIVRYFGKWKKSVTILPPDAEPNAFRSAQLRLQHRQAQLLESSGTKSRRNTTVVDSDDEGSVIRFDQESAQPATIFCGSCRTRDSAVWWKAPKGMSSSVLCDVCGLNWRKYGDHGYSRINRDDPLTAKRVVEKREGTPLAGASTKRQKVKLILAQGTVELNKLFQVVGPMSGDSTPTPPPFGKQPTCQCCKKANAAGRVLKCKKCSLTIHAGKRLQTLRRIVLTRPTATCGAVYDEETAADWVCDVCQNETSLEASLVRNAIIPSVWGSYTYSRRSSACFVRDL